MCKVINYTEPWDSKISMSQFPEAISEVFFWKHNFKSFNCRKLASYTNFQTIGISDASSTGYAANLVINNVRYTAYESRSHEESQTNFTWKEISA